MGETKRRSVLHSARADGDGMRRPWALDYESGEGGGDAKREEERI